MTLLPPPRPHGPRERLALWLIFHLFDHVSNQAAYAFCVYIVDHFPREAPS